MPARAALAPFAGASRRCEVSGIRWAGSASPAQFRRNRKPRKSCHVIGSVGSTRGHPAACARPGPAIDRAHADDVPTGDCTRPCPTPGERSAGAAPRAGRSPGTGRAPTRFSSTSQEEGPVAARQENARRRPVDHSGSGPRAPAARWTCGRARRRLRGVCRPAGGVLRRVRDPGHVASDLRGRPRQPLGRCAPSRWWSRSAPPRPPERRDGGVCRRSVPVLTRQERATGTCRRGRPASCPDTENLCRGSAQASTSPRCRGRRRRPGPRPGGGSRSRPRRPSR